MTGHYRGGLVSLHLVTYLLVAGVIAYVSKLLSIQTALYLCAPALVFTLVSQLLFRKRVTLTDDTITRRTILGTRSMSLTDVASVRFKPWSHVSGASYPSWVILESEDGTRLKLNSDYSEFEAIETRLSASLERHANVDYAAAREQGIERQTLAGPSWEDFPEGLVGMTLLFGSLGYALWVLRALEG